MLKKIKLEATVKAVPLYERLGFKIEFESLRFFKNFFKNFVKN